MNQWAKMQFAGTNAMLHLLRREHLSLEVLRITVLYCAKPASSKILELRLSGKLRRFKERSVGSPML